MTRRLMLACAGACLFALGAASGPWMMPSGSVVHAAPQGKCGGLPSASALAGFLGTAPSADAGGLFGGSRMWGAVVNRDGELCAYATNQADPTQVWPGSQAIAKAKAYTANAFSLDTATGGFPLSTAQLYTFTQPGHSLWSLGQSNLFNTAFLAAPGANGGINQITGGLIFFGGGVALYNGAGKVIGGLGISGDTSCTDHEIAKRVRNLALLNPAGGPTVDDISYSSVDGASAFTHPLCPNTWRNGTPIPLPPPNHNELPASGY
jgi:uncharacterized protein GlcG (DUF336 family)